MDCEQQICFDLVGATVIEHRVPEYKRNQECYKLVTGVAKVDACMELNLTTGVCTIWFDKNPSKEEINHEYSHCNGWQHTWNSRTRRYEWFPMPEVIASQEPPAGSSHKSAASIDSDARQSSDRGQKYPSL